MPLSVESGLCISHNSKHVNPPGKSTIKYTKQRANNGIETDRKYSSEAINGIEKNKIHSLETNNGIEMNKNYICNEITTDLIINPYKRVILKEPINNKDQIPMEDWSILSDHVKYVTHGKSDTFQKLSINFMDYRQNKDLYKSLNSALAIKTSLNFWNSPESLKKTEYLHVYKGIYMEDINTDKFDEDTDISTTYLGKVDMTRDTEVKAEENFPLTARGYTRGHLLDGTDCDVLIDTGASKSYMSKSFFLQCKLLHTMPKFTSITQRIQVGNGQYVSVLSVIPVIINIQSHRFEILTLVSEIHENVDLVLGIKHLFELEGVIDSWNSCFSFLNRSILFSKRKG